MVVCFVIHVLGFVETKVRNSCNICNICMKITVYCRKKKSMSEKTERALVRIDKRLKDAAKSIAATNGETLENYLNRVIESAVNENKPA